MEEFIRVFRALSDRTRLRILCILVRRECCVFEVMLALRISQPRASRHLGVLKAAGFLKSRQKGSRVFYALNDTAGSKTMFGVSEMADAMALRDVALRIDRERLAMIEAGGIGELIGSYRPLVRKYRRGRLQEGSQ